MSCVMEKKNKTKRNTEKKGVNTTQQDKTIMVMALYIWFMSKTISSKQRQQQQQNLEKIVYNNIKENSDEKCALCAMFSCFYYLFFYFVFFHITGIMLL